MGYMMHHAIIVTGWSQEGVAAHHKAASEIFPWVSPISPPAINGYASFFIPPDGSKEGWSESDLGDEQRNEFAAASRELIAKHLWADWVEVAFPGDSSVGKVIRCHKDVLDDEGETRAAE